MIYTTLNTGAKIPMLGLGVYDMYDQNAVSACLTALELGYTLLDTASMYNNEREVGMAIKQSEKDRKELFITTKVGNTDQGYDATQKAIDVSLEKLGLDYVDLYLIHWPLRDSRKDTWRALEQIVKNGKAKAIGVSNYLEPFLDELMEYAGIVPAVNQIEFSPFLYLKSMVDRSLKDGTLLQAYSPLARNQKADNQILSKMGEIYGKSVGQMMLRWIVQKGVCPIPKSASKDRQFENFNIFDFHISDADMHILDALHCDFRVVENPMDFF